MSTSKRRAKPRRFHPWREARLRFPGLTIITTYELPEGQSGAFDPSTNTVYLCRTLTQAERRTTLTHELMHVIRGVIPQDFAWLEQKEERAVDQIAARKLIDVERFIDSLVWAGHKPGEECANELWVDPSMLDAWIGSLTEDEIAYITAEVERRQ